MNVRKNRRIERMREVDKGREVGRGGEKNGVDCGGSQQFRRNERSRAWPAGTTRLPGHFSSAE